MRFKDYTFILLSLVFQPLFAQDYPVFGPEIKVQIEGLTFDAMEPFISLDGNTLFFNSLNSGGNTNLYLATKVNDSTFTYAGLLGGTYDDSPEHLDGVPSIDSLNNFFWVSLRNYPTNFENLHRGNYESGNVSDITRVYGDFNIYTAGWLIMDAAINFEGEFLYYCNAFFNSCDFGIPCDARLGIAQKLNDSTFNKIADTEAILANVNDPNYIVYAPQVTKDGLELYFTRILKNTFNSEICVSVRTSITDIFSFPTVIHSNLGYIPEAASPTTDKQKIYYHQKDETEVFNIYLRYRILSTSVADAPSYDLLKVYPNPASDLINIDIPDSLAAFQVSVFSMVGQEIYREANSASIDISTWAEGMYIIRVEQNQSHFTTRIVKQL